MNGIKRVVVTGAAGFIGAAVASRLARQGVDVIALDLRPPSAATEGIVAVRCDICDARAVARLVRGHAPIDAVVHTAAIVDDFGDPALFRRVNVEGTLNLMRAAESVGVKRFVHLSSIVVCGDDPGFDVSEEAPYGPSGAPYTDTKIESEAIARQFHAAGRLDVAVVRPGDVYGAESVPWVVRPLIMLRDGLFLFFDEGAGLIANTYIDNLVDGIGLALERPEASGQVYTITDGAPTTFRSYLSLLAAAGGFAPPKRSVPMGAALAIAAAAELALPLVGQKPPFSRAAVRWVGRRATYSIEKARRELGYRPMIELAEGMEAIGQWLRRIGGPQRLVARRA
ncbi:MAG: NAD(P)-dependent oxidoreductase [Myxococcales bacterium]|nr:NAD(P)-dependent oxidoreductase [Myxococcales bacterium]